MEELLGYFGVWTWWIVAAALLLLELMVMSIFLVWLGIAALTVGLIDMVAGLGWQAEVLLFAVLSVIYVYLGRRYMKTRAAQETDQPHLNQRVNAFVGRTVELLEPIENGRGKVKFGDAIWQVSGEDAPAGTKVKITAVSGMVLECEPV